MNCTYPRVQLGELYCIFVQYVRSSAIYGRRADANSVVRRHGWRTAGVVSQRRGPPVTVGRALRRPYWKPRRPGLFFALPPRPMGRSRDHTLGRLVEISATARKDLRRGIRRPPRGFRPMDRAEARRVHPGRARHGFGKAMRIRGYGAAASGVRPCEAFVAQSCFHLRLSSSVLTPYGSTGARLGSLTARRTNEHACTQRSRALDP